MAAAASVTTSAKNATAKLTRAEMQRRIDDEGESICASRVRLNLVLLFIKSKL